MTTLQSPIDRVRFTAEGGWVVMRQPCPELADRPPAELLARQRGLRGNLRYVPGDGGVELLAEARTSDGGDGLLTAQQQLTAWLESPPPEVVPAAEDVEAALEGVGLAWTRREHHWAVPATEHLPRELHLHAGPGVVRVEAVLTEWDEVGPDEAVALARFLYAAQAGLRFARCDLDERRACVVAQVDADRLDADLIHGLLGAAAGCRLLARETAALLIPAVARAYREFHQTDR